MKIFISLILFSTLLIFGQNEPHSYVSQDSLIRIDKKIITPITFKPDFFIPLSAINSISFSLKHSLNSFSTVSDNIYELNNDLYFSQSLLKEQFKSSLLYNMLGAIQTGAVGYMAYQHIKKYGLFK
jgi:hypothetical protein